MHVFRVEVASSWELEWFLVQIYWRVCLFSTAECERLCISEVVSELIHFGWTALCVHGKERPAAERAASVFGSLLPPSISRIASESIVGTSAAAESTHSLSASESKPEAAQSSSVVTPEVSESRNEDSDSVETGVHRTEAGSTDVQTHEHESQPSIAQSMSAEAGISVEESLKANVRENGAGGHEEEEQSGMDDVIEEVLPNAQAEERSADQLTKVPKPVEVESNVDHGSGINGVHHGVQVKNDAVDNGVPELSKELSNSDMSPQISTPTLEMVYGTNAAETELLQPKDFIESQPSLLETSENGGDKVEKEMKMMEAALLGAARQAQVSQHLTLESLSSFMYILYRFKLSSIVV